MSDQARDTASAPRLDLGHVDALIRQGKADEARAAFAGADPGEVPEAARELRLARIAALFAETEASDRHAARAARLLTAATEDSLAGYVNAVLNMGDSRDAAAEMSALAARFAGHAEPIFGLARLAARAGRHEDALAHAADGLACDAAHWQLHRFRLLELIRLGRDDEIDGCVDAVRAAFGEGEQLAQTREILKSRPPRFPASEADPVPTPAPAPAPAPTPVEAPAPAPAPQRDTVAEVLERAKTLADAGKLDDAVGLLCSAAGQVGNDVHFCLLEGELREQNGDLDGARAAFERGASLQQQNPRPRILLSRLALRCQRNAEALAHAEAAVAIAPTSSHTHLVRCDALASLDRREALVQAVAAFLALSPDGGQLVRVARHCERLNLVEPMTAVLQQGLRCDVPSEAIVNHIVSKATSRVQPDILARWVAALAQVLPSKPVNRLSRRELFEAGEFADVVRLVRQIPTRERDFREAGDLYEALLGLRRYKIAQRYVAFAARYWPLQMVQRLFMLHIRFGELAKAAAVLERAEEGHILGGEVLAAMHHTLALQSRAPADLVTLALKSPAPESLLVHSLRYAIGVGDLAAARKALPLVRGHNRQRKLHWQSTLEGQLSNEMTQLAAVLGEETIVDLAHASNDVLARHVIDNSWSIILATTYLARFGSRPPPEQAQGAPIARVIHQYWDESPPPPDIAELMTSWDGYRDFGHEVLSKRDAVQFLRADYGEEWVNAFRLANNPAEAADFLRLCLLAKRGGVWIDADDEAIGSLDRLIRPGNQFVVFREPIGGAVANNFVAASPSHPILVSAAALAKRTLLARSSESTWAKTGPGLLTRVVAQFLAQTGRTADVTLHEQSVLRREVAIHTPLAHKRSATYWNASSATDPVLTALIKSHTAALENAQSPAE